jgi:ubiquinone/menaquinone biosynthesis C-methylase UbiE
LRSLFEHNQAAHDRIAEAYDAKHAEIFNPREQARIEETIDELLSFGQATTPKVLDYGSGTGNLALKFLRRGCRVTALDISARSLEVLRRKAGAATQLEVCMLRDDRIPFDDASFEVVATYSVLHHVPDYLSAVAEMARVLKPGGMIYIDHEFNDAAWSDDPNLRAYRSMTHLTPGQHFVQLLRTGELFTLGLAKTVFMKALVNRRYEREGDLHVWHDDHIEWKCVVEVLQHSQVEVTRTYDYLMYQPRGGAALYDRYRSLCSDLRCIFGRKRGAARTPAAGD